MKLKKNISRIEKESEKIFFPNLNYKVDLNRLISEWKSIYKEMIPTLTHNKKQLENSENKHLVDEMVKKL